MIKIKDAREFEREKVKTEHMDIVEKGASMARGMNYENSIWVEQSNDYNASENQVDKYLMPQVPPFYSSNQQK